jgi:hypothetical protein
VRPHPYTAAAAYRSIAAAYPRGRVVVAESAPMSDLITAADVLLTQHSTVAIEGAIAAVPVILADLTGLPDMVPFAACGIGAPARDAHTVTALVDRVRLGGDGALLDRAVVERGLRRLAGPLDGAAAARVAAFLGELLGDVRSAPSAR